MKIQDLNGKNICVLGYGREGKAMVNALEDFTPECEITIADKNAELENENGELEKTNHWLQLGSGWLENLEKFDVIIKSPGIPPSIFEDNGYDYETVSNKLTSSTQIFFDTVAELDAVTIGVTGTKGKSTTASLIHAILKAAGKDAILVGNIGEPAIAHLDEVKEGTIVVMEMSSYQLERLETSPHIAVVTSFFPDHLDYHGSLEDYLEAKMNIALHQEDNDMVFFNGDSEGAMKIARQGRGRKLAFTVEDSLIDVDQTHLIGLHNQSNIAAATLVAMEFFVPKQTIIDAVKNFRGLRHRLESLGVHHGIEWIDDAISTTPESTIAGIRALNGKVRTIILGGQDRGYDFDQLAREVIMERISTVILFPGSGQRIREALMNVGYEGKIFDASSMEEAVALAIAHTKQEEMPASDSVMPPPVVLLSTASPSYGMFKNFEEKGDRFRACIPA